MTVFSDFGDADRPWLPELIDIEAKKSGPEGDYYSRFGWENLEVPADCPNVTTRMRELKVRFDERYANRMLNAETLERWQIRLQNRFDEKVHIYERAYELYGRYEQDMLSDVMQGEKTVVTGTNIAGGSDTSTANTRNRNIDTPDEAVNADEDYASSLSDGTSSGTTTYGRTDSVNSTTTKTMTGRALVEGINDAIYSWRDLDTEFVKEFENNFLNVMWY